MTSGDRPTRSSKFRAVAEIVLGIALILVGVGMLVAPGPGLVVLAIGGTLVARHVPWARRRLEAVGRWLRRVVLALQTKGGWPRDPPSGSRHEEDGS
jgi:hypothetical protein